MQKKKIRVVITAALQLLTHCRNSAEEREEERVLLHFAKPVINVMKPK